MSEAVIEVVVVDDDYRVATVHAGFVDRVPGFRVVGMAHSAAEARRVIDEKRPHLVLMDIYLPDGDGLDVVRDLAAEAHAPSVIVVSAAKDVESIRTALRLGAVHYISKPFGFAALVERLIAFQRTLGEIAALPEESTQDDIDRLFGALRPPEPAVRPRVPSMAPTVKLVFDRIAHSGVDGASAAQVAAEAGISRATAQRYLSQLEQSGHIVLTLRYGSTGRPEHVYTTPAARLVR
ncbi:MAG: response regulator [Microbacterium ginsengisoli]|jgi:response regulator of citrate/malate metabolism|uniref:Transcriptional regulatory protein n=1 Tax=Microbacterium ginsengisoli TaxID=400772 RepID=A0A0F0LV60_9MICO|nr:MULTISPECIES: response regulator [Microbacterium]KJL36569.1 Transcriptional regulatory protein DpiA [Microbacterium ginsengisoli]KQR91649.1 hypothetical protein ASF93_06985 [Microbacterium sp. Leaf347]KQR91722.1 hypothetical protein ASG00_04375 [Microbacterium sp. Leaf351]MBN9197875.1 response regulator [Microbacterium ginsengisoli]MBN9207105.1 response regulator [Microbacterium ginsengisoli]